MKAPHIEKFKRVLFCTMYREECKKVKKDEKKCCGNCKGPEEIFQYRNI